MFINFTNHPSSRWAEEQLAAAARYGEIVDYPFPAVNPTAQTEDVVRRAEECAARILERRPDYVLCQGEFCLAYHVIRLLKAQGVAVGAACSERNVVEKAGEDGTRKTVTFRFVQYRDY